MTIKTIAASGSTVKSQGEAVEARETAPERGVSKVPASLLIPSRGDAVITDSSFRSPGRAPDVQGFSLGLTPPKWRVLGLARAQWA